MNIKEVLKDFKVENQRLILSKDYSENEMCQIRMILQRMLKDGEIPVYRPFAWFCHTNQDHRTNNNDYNGYFHEEQHDMVQRLARTHAAAKFPEYDKSVFNFTYYGSEEPLPAYNRQILKIGGVATNAIYNPEYNLDIQVTHFCKDTLSLENRAIVSVDYKVFTEGQKHNSYIMEWDSPNETDFQNLYGLAFDHFWDRTLMNSSSHMYMNDTLVRFFTFYVKGTGHMSLEEAALLMHKDYRYLFTFADVDFSLDDLFSIGPALNGHTIDLIPGSEFVENWAIRDVLNNIE